MPQNLHERPATSAPLDAAAARRAHIRAVAAGLIDGPRMSRRFHVPAGVALQPSPRRRRHQNRTLPAIAETRRRPRVRRVLAGALLVVQVGLLAALLFAPAFRLRTVDVRGGHLLSRQTVLSVAHIPSTSLFTIDGQSIEARLARLPWVRSVTVTTQLPSTLRIALTEWQPQVLLRHGARNDFVAADGATVAAGRTPAGTGAGVPVLLDYRPGAQQPLVDGLAELLWNAAQRWQAVYGCSIDAFVLSSSNVLSAWCSTGWEAVFGTLDSTAAVAAIPQQLAVLAALHGRIDFVHPKVGYVDLENPAAPTSGGHPGEPPALRSAIGGGSLSAAPPVAGPLPPSPAPLPSPAASSAPAGAATPAPTPTAAPTPTSPATPPPTPTPAVFSLPPPPPSPHG